MSAPYPTTYIVEVDTTDLDGTLASAQRLGVDVLEFDLSGGGGGWPSVRARGTKDALLQFLAEHNGNSAETAVEYFDEFAEVS